MAKPPSLTKLLASKDFPKVEDSEENEKVLEELQRKVLRVQQGIWHQKTRAIILFEGFDASGKGGAIRRLVSGLDPRGYQVHPIGPPRAEDQGKHYLYRFWRALPEPGTIALFDRSWYGRVLVERVQKRILKSRWTEAYREITEFESILQDDGIELVKIFMGISKRQQLVRFQNRLDDPYKQWKLTLEDVDARRHWERYVEAAEEMLERTHSRRSPWHLIPANDKAFARTEVLKTIAKRFKKHSSWIESKAQKRESQSLAAALKKLGYEKRTFG